MINVALQLRPYPNNNCAVWFDRTKTHISDNWLIMMLTNTAAAQAHSSSSKIYALSRGGG